jgi:hypothetical protein
MLDKNQMTPGARNLGTGDNPIIHCARLDYRNSIAEEKKWHIGAELANLQVWTCEMARNNQTTHDGCICIILLDRGVFSRADLKSRETALEATP